MNDILTFISGHVPGGLLLLFFILFSVNVALYFFYKSSKLFSKDVYKNKAWKYNLTIVGMYIFLWIYLQPAKLPDRVIILPFQNAAKADFVLCEAVEQQVGAHLANKYMLYRWDWFYHTTNPDSVDLKQYRNDLAQRLGISVIISGDIVENKEGFTIHFDIKNSGHIKSGQISAKSIELTIRQLIDKIIYYTDIITKDTKDSTTEKFPYQKFTKAKRIFLDRDYKRCLALSDRSQLKFQILRANALLKMGIKNLPKTAESNLKPDFDDPYFKRVKQILIPYSKKGEDTAELNLVLGQLYLYEKDYGMAEICLEKARSQDRYNSRIYYYMSFLLVDRIRELNFKDRIDVLNYCARLDPGYSEAIYELANEYYNTGPGIPNSSHTENAIKVLQDYLKINGNQPAILSLLGKIYLQSKFTEDAMNIFRRLLQLEPKSAEANYDLGICYFHIKDYEKAEQLFKKAIELEDHSDSYVYLGAIYELRENWDAALHYFRERIKRKSGDDDKYAKEAMRGVRLILARMKKDSVESGKVKE